MKIIKKVAVFNYKEFENSLLEMNNRELEVDDLMVPIDLAKVLKFIRKDSFSVKELLDQDFQLELIVAAADYMRPELFENQTILDEITGNVEYADTTDEDFPFFLMVEKEGIVCGMILKSFLLEMILLVYTTCTILFFN
ncbi:hypothetical protein ACT7C3_28670 [Bacillus pacificus]